ncbi:MAG: ABC transporter permease, partial [Acidimicrobiia bacterium]
PPDSSEAAPGTSGPGRLRRWADAIFQVKSLTLLAVVLVVGYLALTPLAFLVHGTLFDDAGFTLAGFERAYGFSGIAEMIRNSLVFAVGAAILSFVVGTSLAYITVRTNVPFKSLLVATALVPLIIPSLLYTISWIMLSSENVGLINQISTSLVGRPIFNIFSMAGMIWVEGTDTAPLVFLFMAAAFRGMDPSLEECALVCGASRWTMLRKVTIPLVRPAITGAMLIIAVKALESFEVPTLLGLPDRIYVFTSRIYFELQNFDFGSAGALSINLLLFSVIGVYAVNKLRGQDRDFATVTGKGFRPQAIDLGRARWPVAAGVLFWFFITAVLPFCVMLYTSFLPYFQKFSLEAVRSFSWDNYEAVFTNRIFTRAVTNSLILSVTSATFIMVLVGVAAWLVVRTRIRGVQILDQMTFLPLVVPGLVMGVALSFVYLRNPLPWQIYGTMWILFIAYATRFMPYGMRYAVPSITQISSELEESAAVSGATWWQTNRRILFPLMLPGLLAGWIYILVVSIRELSSSLLLYSPSNEVLSIVIWLFNEKGELTAVSAIGVLLVMFLVIVVTIAYKVGGRIGLQD